MAGGATKDGNLGLGATSLPPPAPAAGYPSSPVAVRRLPASARLQSDDATPSPTVMERSRRPLSGTPPHIPHPLPRAHTALHVPGATRQLTRLQLVRMKLRYEINTATYMLEWVPLAAVLAPGA